MALNLRDPGAAVSLAWMYRIGIGVEKNLDEAHRFFVIGSEAGSGKAAVDLGILYKRGNEIPQDLDQALKYFKLADEKEEPVAATELGLMYLEGAGGLEENFDEAMRYFRKACKGG